MVAEVEDQVVPVVEQQEKEVESTDCTVEEPTSGTRLASMEESTD